MRGGGWRRWLACGCCGLWRVRGKELCVSAAARLANGQRKRPGRNGASKREQTRAHRCTGIIARGPRDEHWNGPEACLHSLHPDHSLARPLIHHHHYKQHSLVALLTRRRRRPPAVVPAYRQRPSLTLRAPLMIMRMRLNSSCSLVPSFALRPHARLSAHMYSLGTQLQSV